LTKLIVRNSKCNGCHSLIYNDCFLLKYNNEELPCPCTKCIIKVSCETACEDFKGWQEKAESKYKQDDFTSYRKKLIIETLKNHDHKQEL